MLVACRQLSFWQRLQVCDNAIVRTLLTSGIGVHGLFATAHLQTRRQYNLLALNLWAVRGHDVRNMFAAELKRFVETRNALALT